MLYKKNLCEEHYRYEGNADHVSIPGIHLHTHLTTSKHVQPWLVALQVLNPSFVVTMTYISHPL